MNKVREIVDCSHPFLPRCYFFFLFFRCFFFPVPVSDQPSLRFMESRAGLLEALELLEVAPRLRQLPRRRRELLVLWGARERLAIGGASGT